MDVGVLEYNYKDAGGRSKRSQLEVDFIAGKGNCTYYVQSAFSIADEEKRLQETNSLRRIPDSFKKIVVVRDDILPWHDDSGILYVGVEQFLLDEHTLEL